MKIEQEITIKEHQVNQLGTPDVSESIGLPAYPNGYDKPAEAISGTMHICNQGDLLFRVGDRIRVTIEKIEGGV